MAGALQHGIGRTRRSPWRRLWRARDGSMAVEFALIAPVLIAIMVPVIDISVAIYTRMQVQNAAQAGAEYALAKGWNQTNVQNAITNAVSFLTVTASPAPTLTYQCVNGSGTGLVASSSGAACSGGGTAGSYVTANAQASYTPLVSYPGFSGTTTYSSTAVVRIQ
jgi:Flp pilus assembly protein TadG